MTGSLTTSFVRDNAVALAGHVLVYSQGLILMPVIIKSVGSETYGGFVVLSSILNVVCGLSSLGVGYTAARMMPSTQGLAERRGLFIPQFAFQMASISVLSALLLLLDGPIRTLVFKDRLDYSAIVVPVYLLSYVFYAQGTNYFRFTSRVPVMIAAGVAFPLINIAIVLGALFVRSLVDVNLLVTAQAAAALVIGIPMAWMIQREIGLRPTFGSRAAFVADLRIGFPLVLNFVVDFLLAASDRWIISVYMGLSAVAYYYPAYAIGSLIMMVPRAVSTALPQLLARAVDGSREREAQQMMSYAIRIFLLLAMPFVVGCIVLGKSLLSILGNEEIAERGYMVVPIVAAGSVFFGMSLLLSNVLFVRRKPGTIFRMNALAAVVNVVWNVVLLYFVRDILVAAWSTLAGYVIAFGYVLKSLDGDWPIDWQPAIIVKSLVASGLMGGVVVLLRTWTPGHDGIGMIAVEIAAGAVAYGCALLAVGGVSPKEIAFMKAQLR